MSTTPNPVYNADYFINKFNAIPDDKWCCGYYVHPVDSETRCAIGHCGRKDINWFEQTEECLELIRVVIGEKPTSAHTNLQVQATQNGQQLELTPPLPGCKGATPKERILKALELAKKDGR